VEHSIKKGHDISCKTNKEINCYDKKGKKPENNLLRFITKYGHCIRNSRLLFTHEV